MGNVHQFKAKVRYGFGITLDAKQTNKTIDSILFKLSRYTTYDTNQTINNEEKSDTTLKIKVSGYAHVFQTATDLIDATNYFFQKQKVFNLDFYEATLKQRIDTTHTDTNNNTTRTLSFFQDTIELGSDSLMLNHNLKNLTSFLQTARDTTWWIFIEVEALNNTPALWRVGSPSLSKFEKDTANTVDSSNHNLGIIRANFGFNTVMSRMVIENNFSTFNNPYLLTGYDTRLHILMDRQKLITQIQSQDTSFLFDTSLAFNNQFFIAKSLLSFNVDTANAKYSGNYKLRLNLESRLDSLIQHNDSALTLNLTAGDDTVSTPLLVQQPATNQLIDTLFLQYQPTLDSNIYQIRIGGKQNNITLDSIYLSQGQSQYYRYRSTFKLF